VDGFAGGVVARIDHRVEAETRCDLRHLLVYARHVDGPDETRASPKDRLLPAQTFHAHLDEGFAAREVDRRFEKERVDQLHAALANPLLELRHPVRVEIEDGDHRVAFRQRESVVRVVPHAVEVVEVAVGAVVALGGPVRKPAAACRMEVGDDEDFRRRVRLSCPAGAGQHE